MKRFLSIFLIFALFSCFNSVDEIKYRLTTVNTFRFIDRFTVTFNSLSGIQAEYLETGKSPKAYNLTTEELGLPSLKELFKLFNKINFPEQTDWRDKNLFDVPYWHLYVDGKDYTSNRGTEFLSQFSNIVNLTNIKEYCKSRY